ncbi:MAG: hypothetical protein HKN73_17065, partial [Gemmatimonadetes bacterium]|nr:hypothetical protein [Gemmatimonadota bacterium]
MRLGLFAMLAFLATAGLGWAAGIGPRTSDPTMAPDSAERSLALGVHGVLPDDVRESSGVSVSGHEATLLWTHNDGPDPRLFLVRRTGALAGVVTIDLRSIVDLEDIDVGPCPAGLEGSSCLYVADTGDNQRNRESYSILIGPEPTPEVMAGALPTRLEVRELRFRYPDQSRDAEALAVSASGEVFVVTKGQEGASEVFRIPDSGADQVVVAEPVADLPIPVEDKASRITAAAFGPRDHDFVVRSDDRLFLFSWGSLDVLRAECPLPDAGQGEGVDFLTEELFVVTREG